MRGTGKGPMWLSGHSSDKAFKQLQTQAVAGFACGCTGLPLLWTQHSSTRCEQHLRGSRPEATVKLLQLLLVQAICCQASLTSN